MELVNAATKTIVIGLAFLEFVRGNIVKNWNYCPLQSEAIHLVPKVSLDECLKQCSVRNHCQMICYRTKLKLCEIHEEKAKNSSCRSCVSVVREAILAEKENGAIGVELKDQDNVTLWFKLLILLFAGDTIIVSDSAEDLQRSLDIFGNYCTNWYLKFVSACGCDVGQTCDAPSGSCDYTECGKLPDSFLDINGNLAYVDATKIAGCKNGSKGNSTIVICGSEGQWKNMPRCEMCPTDGIINVTDSFRIKVFKQAVSQQKAIDNCKQACGLLAKMDQTNKMDTISKMLIASREFTNSGYWVDGYSTNPKDPNSWKFSNGTQMPMEKDVYWPVHAPNYNSQPACTRLSKQSDYLMDDTGCDTKFHFICEM